jgi:hypothetical protein
MNMTITIKRKPRNKSAVILRIRKAKHPAQLKPSLCGVLIFAGVD